MQSYTPETDAIVEQCQRTINVPTNPVPAEFARKLEIQRNEEIMVRGQWCDRARKALLEVGMLFDMLRNIPPGMNHYCCGESGLGEWSCRSELPSTCGYCGEPNEDLRQANGESRPAVRVIPERRVECCGASWDSHTLTRCPRCNEGLVSKQNSVL